MISAIVSLMLLGLALGTLLGFAARHLAVEGNPLADEINELLPGSQCGQCGYPGCAPAALAIANGDAPVTICPPGGTALAEALANKMGVELVLDDIEEQGPQIAFINAETCTGCTKCLKVCPSDAMLGAPKQIHVVFNEACNGCGKCVEVCPVESAVMRPVPSTINSWYWPKPKGTAFAEQERS